MSGNLPQEQPPTEDPVRLKEWLTRLVFQVNGLLTNVFNLNKTPSIPEFVEEGMIRYFNDGIDPEIAYKGPWIYTGDEWRPLVSMVHKGFWVPGTTYYPQDVVSDGSWTMSANKTTLDRPAPTATGPKETLIPNAPSWIARVNTSVVWSGNIYSFTQDGWLGGIRIWVDEISATTNYRISIIDVTDIDNPLAFTIEEPVLKLNAWTTVLLTNRVILAGTVLIIYLDALDSGTTDIFLANYVKSAPSQSVNPPNGNYNTNTQKTLLRVTKFDQQGLDRSVGLLEITVNSTIKFTDTNDNTNTITYRVKLNPTDAIGYIEFAEVEVISAEGDIPVGQDTILRAETPVTSATQYVEIPDFWLTGQPSWAAVEGLLIYDGVIQTGTLDSAFGVDIAFTPGEASPDWNFIAYSRSGSGGVLGIYEIVNTVLLDTFSIVAQNAVSIDVPIQIDFGAAQTSADNSASIDANGTVTFNRAADYDIEIILHTSRDMTNDEAVLIFSAQVNGNFVGSSLAVTITDKQQATEHAITFVQNFQVGDTLAYFMTRDSSGVNDGGLFPLTPVNVALPPVRSAKLKVSRRDVDTTI